MGTLPSIDEVWRRIEAHQGETFHTKRGFPLTYSVSGRTLTTSRAKQGIGVLDFAKALEIVPFEGPGAVTWDVRGPAYIWAILHDPRIRQRDW